MLRCNQLAKHLSNMSHNIQKNEIALVFLYMPDIMSDTNV